MASFSSLTSRVKSCNRKTFSKSMTSACSAARDYKLVRDMDLWHPALHAPLLSGEAEHDGPLPK
jgi:hypothetical protein